MHATGDDGDRLRGRIALVVILLFAAECAMPWIAAACGFMPADALSLQMINSDRDTLKYITFAVVIWFFGSSQGSAMKTKLLSMMPPQVQAYLGPPAQPDAGRVGPAPAAPEPAPYAPVDDDLEQPAPPPVKPASAP